MFTTVAALLLLAAIGYLGTTLHALQRNISVARTSGLPYKIVPFKPYSLIVLMGAPILKNLISRTSPAAAKTIVAFISPISAQRFTHQLFKDLDADTFLLVSPGGIILYTADAPVVHQITTRRRDFPKPLAMYKNIDVFGKNVVTSEGDQWRLHRKITAPPFGERNNVLVWEESIHLAQEMLKTWTRTQQTSREPIWNAVNDTMRLSLSVIARAGFGQRLPWPGSEAEKANTAGNVWPGHEMSFKDTVSVLLDSLLPIVIFGKALDYLPFSWARSAKVSWKEWNSYMQDMLEGKRRDIAAGAKGYDNDLLGALTLAAKGDSKAARPLLSDEEIQGNAFVFILAGHETTSNSILYSLIYLAMYPDVQRQAQADVDKIFGGREPSTWSYEQDMPKLFNSLVWAVVLEQLRMIPAVTDIPKSTAAPQSITINGVRHVIPGDINITLRTPGIHRNPKYWPHTDVADLDVWRPARWLEHTGQQSGSKTAADDEEAEYANPDAATSSSLYKPVEGSFIPFSDGARSCIGKRFAQVELVAVLSVVLSQYTVELALDDFATPEEVQAMDNGRRKEAWGKAKDRATWVFDERLVSKITTQMVSGERTPLRFSRRGEEIVKHD